MLRINPGGGWNLRIDLILWDRLLNPTSSLIEKLRDRRGDGSRRRGRESQTPDWRTGRGGDKKIKAGEHNSPAFI